MSVADLATTVLLVLSAAFFTGGTLGLLRFPDIYCRLHAPAKADNVALGLLAVALAVQAESIAVAAKLLLIWLLTMFVGACASYLVARGTYQEDNGEPPSG